jgi:pimeloyl-ACP methyl ester carboxylesterase
MRKLLIMVGVCGLGWARPLDARLEHYDYPYAVRTLPIKSQMQSLEMAYMDVSPRQPNGKSVLLLHGKNFSGAYWKRTIELLSSQGYRVVVPDQIGFGKSSKPRQFQFSFQEMARQTAQLLQHLQVSKVQVVGHSMGGMLATRFSLMYPERVASLTLVNPIGLEDWKLQVPYHSVDQNYAAEQKTDPKSYMRDNYFHGEWKADYDFLTEIPNGWKEGPDRDLIAWESALTSDMVFTQPVVYEFNRVQAPTQLIIGQLDTTAIGKAWATPAARARMGHYPQLGRQTQRKIPHCELVEIAGAGHLPQVERWDEYSRALLQFLKKY